MLKGSHRQMLLLDEVTTGFDSETARRMVELQRRKAREQQLTVMMVMQQPSPELVDMFDSVLLLADGHILFHGPLNAAIPHFRTLGLSCPIDVPLAEFLLDIGSIRQLQYQVGSKQSPGVPVDLAAAFRRSNAYNRFVGRLKSPSACNPPTAYNTSRSHNTAILLKREMKLVRRNKAFSTVRAIAVAIMALLYGSLLYQVGVMDIQVAVGVCSHRPFSFPSDRQRISFVPKATWLLKPRLSYR